MSIYSLLINKTMEKSLSEKAFDATTGVVRGMSESLPAEARALSLGEFRMGIIFPGAHYDLDERSPAGKILSFQFAAANCINDIERLKVTTNGDAVRKLAMAQTHVEEMFYCIQAALTPVIQF